MKRKLFTLLIALLAVVGYQASAQVIVGLKTGKYDPPAACRLSFTTPLPFTQTFTNERGGYPGPIATANKLTYKGNGTFVVAAGDPVINEKGSIDQITIDNPTSNFVTIAAADGKKLTLKDGGGTSQSQFVVFMGTPVVSTDQITTGYTNVSSYGSGDADYYTTYTGGGYGEKPGLMVESQPFNQGNFMGFLGVQAGGRADDANLLIVVHDAAGNLSLMQYGDYVNSLNKSIGTVDKDNKYFPLFIQTIHRSGRWATPNDFASCKFWQFTSQGLEKSGIVTNGEILQVKDAVDVQKKTADATLYSTFTVKQVDYVVDGGGNGGHWPLPQISSMYNQNTNNIITHMGGGLFQGRNADLTASDGTFYGTTNENPLTQAINPGKIPLFVISSPENCKVLSVSRINDLQGQGGFQQAYANQLELRDYAQYYTYDKNASGKYNYTPHVAEPTTNSQGDAADINYDTYTSLQKFAVWIDEDGYMTLYPVASYFWQYGQPKGDTNTGENSLNPVNIQPNAVLIYNDVNVTWRATTDPVFKLNGWQIGWWNGKNTTAADAAAGFATAPNVVQPLDDYATTPFLPSCNEDNSDMSGRFYFLQTYTDTTDLWKTKAEFYKDGIQWQRDHVLATRLVPGNDANAGSKALTIVPKEKIRGDAANKYWLFPYDSVNMAAHWELRKVDEAGGVPLYRLINMLGDTLQYNRTDVNLIRGGYQTVNRLMPGAEGTDAGKKYFGRPDVEGTDAANWFAPATNRTNSNTLDLWKIHKINGKNEFFLELANSGGYELTLLPDLTPGVKGWYNTGDSRSLLEANKSGAASTPSYYYQQNVVLTSHLISSIESYKTGDAFSTCPGLKLTMENIYYVPTYGPFNDQEQVAGDNKIINTNDKTFQQQDSLTAYTFLTGSYAIQEALAVNNSLSLSYENVSINDVNNPSATANIARLKTTDLKLEFIPLDSPLGEARKANIQALQTQYQVNDPLAWLWGETYKWYIVKQGDKYLSFDWVNMTAGTNREKVGLVFVDSLANAVPVRLYEPLVGDKQNTYFLFQFYMPNYKYYPSGSNEKLVATNFPDIESSTLGALRKDMTVGKDEVCYATLSNQSDFIFATRAYTGLSTGTRFAVKRIPTPPCVCQGIFVGPEWMGAERLLNLPLNNQLWESGEALSAWVGKGDDARVKEVGIVSNTEGDTKITTLSHTYVTTIYDYAGTKYAEAGVHKVMIPGASLPGDTTWIGGAKGFKVGSAIQAGKSFETDLPVPLYYVQNADDQYLTVIAENDMTASSGANQTTVTDVNGVKLAWRDKYEYNSDSVYYYGFDKRALQLFAISGCEEAPTDGWFGEFIYLPLASYQWDYAAKKAITKTISNVPGKAPFEVNAIYYNEHLGKGFTVTGCLGDNLFNDLQDCWRVGQYSWVGSPVKNLVVFNSSSTVTGGNLIPIQVKWEKNGNLTPECESVIVQKLGYEGSLNKFYTFDGFNMFKDGFVKPTEYDLLAHWNTTIKSDDDNMVTFAPELQTIYDKEVGVGKDIAQTQLAGQYFFFKPLKDANGDVVEDAYVGLDVSGYANNDFRPVFDTLRISCTDHKVPFYDLESDGHFNVVLNKLAILETPFTDRGLNDRFTTKNGPQMTEIYGNDGKVIGYQTYLDSVGYKYSNAGRVTVYKENRRQLTDNHVIPYYSFSVTENRVEYFLNVTQTEAGDSVRWTALSDADKAILVDCGEGSANEYAFKTYKFCLPYKKNADGTFADSIAYPKENGENYPPVYLQTLDDAVNDFPFLIVAGSATNFVTQRTLDDAILATYQKAPYNTLRYNIYSVDYSFIDVNKVTSWIFGGELPNGNVWVPVPDVVANAGNTKVGALTSLGGSVTFVDQSQKDPNFAIMTGTPKESNLTLTYGGSTLIGAYLPLPIWYYRISIDGNYLTDATGMTDAAYQYTFNGKTYPIAFFGKLLADATDNKVENNISADKNFVQSFGFRYFSGDEFSPDQQAFYIVSNANYKNKPTHENEYRFLALINDQMVFVTDTQYALVFQWGGVKDGEYTDLQVVGQGGIYGVPGGVKFVDTTGKVDIYSVDGRLIKTSVLTGAEQVLSAPRGIAIVKTGSKVVKVVVQ